MRKLKSALGTYFRFYFVLIVLIIGALYWAHSFVQPAPPTSFTLAAGKNTGAYYGFAAKYARELEKEGIHVEIVATDGTMDNAQRLKDPASTIDVAFIQSGVVSPTPSDEIYSLASVFYEPFWLFYRAQLPIKRMSDFQGLRISAGLPEGGTYTLARRLFSENGIDSSSLQIMDHGEAAKQLASGALDAACFVGRVNVGHVESLIKKTDFTLFDCPRAVAFNSLFPFLSVLTLPEGIINLKDNIPPHDITLLSACATLACKKDFHPALIEIFMQTLTKVHQKGGIFEQYGEFPSDKYIDYPLSPNAKRYFKFGPPLLQRFLPFWLASLLDRLKVMILPMLVLLIPLFKVVPPMLKWRITRKINRWYKKIQCIDIQLDETTAPENLEQLSDDLRDIEHRVLGIAVPAGYADRLYDLRLHIDLVRSKITRFKAVKP